MGWLLRRVLGCLRFLLFLPLTLLRLVVGLLVRPEVLVIRFRGKVPDFTDKRSKLLSLLTSRPPQVSHREAMLALDEATRAQGLRTVLVILDQAELALVQAETLIAGIQRVQEAGVKVCVWGDGLTGASLAVAAQGDRALGASAGTLGFLGVRVRNLFLADFFAQVGIVPQLRRHGDYKTYADMFMRQSMSEAHREMSTELATDLHAQISDPIAQGRGIEAADLRAALDDAPVDHERAAELGILDEVAFRDQAVEKAAELGGSETPEEARSTSSAIFALRRRRRLKRRSILRDPKRVAVIQLTGGIVDGEDGRGCPATLACEAIDAARKDDDLSAVVLRIDSPGGSVTASERIWRAVKRLDEEKPVVASLGRVAASGGYYIAVGARTIVAHAATLTGSIGVVSGKLHLAPALRRLGVGVDAVQVGARADMFDPDVGLDEAADEALFRQLMGYYRTFVTRVADGRSMSFEAVDALAQGRVYTGRIAQGHGLVDRVGGLRMALEIAREQAELGEHVAVEFVPVKAERGLLSTLGGGSLCASPLGSLEDAWAQARAFAHAPALAYCPLDVLGA